MKIKRDKEKKELTPEELELKSYKRAKNIGLASLGTGAAFYGISKIGKGYNKIHKDRPENQVDRKDINFEKAAAIGLGAIGLGLHGIGAVKYRKLKKKLREKEEDDNSKKED